MSDTLICVVLDRSGSMMTTKQDAEGGFNNFIEEQAKVAGKCLVTLSQFDTVYERVYSAVPVADVPKLTLVPRGNTALFDAIGKTINDLDADLAQVPDDQQPTDIFLVIITDGEENSSREFTHAQIRDLITAKQTAGWQIVYVGAGVDAYAAGVGLGVSPTTTLSYSGTGGGTQAAYTAVASAVSASRVTGQAATFTEEDRAATWADIPGNTWPTEPTD